MDPKNYEFTDSKLNTGNYKYRLKQIDYNGNFEYYDLTQTVSIGTPDKYNVSEIYPNPSNPISKMDYQLPALSKVSVKVFDITGKEVATLVDATQQAGYYSVQFDGTNFASGIYFYRIIAENSSQTISKTKKLILIR